MAKLREGMRVRLLAPASWMAVGATRGWNGFQADSSPCVVPAGTVGAVSRKEYFEGAFQWAVDWDGIVSETTNEQGLPLFCGLGCGADLPDYMEEV